MVATARRRQIVSKVLESCLYHQRNRPHINYSLSTESLKRDLSWSVIVKPNACLNWTDVHITVFLIIKSLAAPKNVTSYVREVKGSKPGADYFDSGLHPFGEIKMRIS